MTKSKTLQSELLRAISWAADLRSSTSARWPSTPTDEEIRWLKLRPGQYWTGPGELIILVITEDGRPQAYQCEWDPGRRSPQSKQTLVARLFHIDDTITVHLEFGFEHLLRKI